MNVQITGLSRELLVSCVGVLRVVGLFLNCKLPNKILIGQSLLFLPFSLNSFSLFSGLLRLLTKALLRMLRMSEADENSSLKPQKLFDFLQTTQTHFVTLITLRLTPCFVPSLDLQGWTFCRVRPRRFLLRARGEVWDETPRGKQESLPSLSASELSGEKSGVLVSDRDTVRVQFYPWYILLPWPETA